MKPPTNPASGLVGTGEIAAILGCSRQWVHELSQRPDWPGPAGKVGKSFVWTLADIEAWMQTHPPPGSAKTGRNKRPSRPTARPGRGI